MRRTRAVLKLQKNWRGHAARLVYNKRRSFVIKLQMASRAYLSRKRVLQMRYGRSALTI